MGSAVRYLLVKLNHLEQTETEKLFFISHLAEFVQKQNRTTSTFYDKNKLFLGVT